MKLVRNVFIGLGLILAVACSSKAPYTPPAAPHVDNQVVKRYQTSKGCLDVGKLFQELGAAAYSRSYVTDVQILTDGTPVSEEFRISVIKQLNVLENPYKPTTAPVEQADCSKISGLQLDENGTPEDVTINNASPTKIEVQKVRDSNLSDRYVQETYELLGNGKFRVTTDADNFTVDHNTSTCGIHQEFHEVMVTAVVDYSDSVLPVAPAQTASFLGLQRRAATEQATGDAAVAKRIADESAYCEKLKH